MKNPLLLSILLASASCHAAAAQNTSHAAATQDTLSAAAAQEAFLDSISRQFCLDEVVVTGTRTPKFLKDTPIQTRVISSKDIAKLDATNVQDILQV